MILKPNQSQIKVFAPMPIRDSHFTRTCFSTFQIPKRGRREREMKPPTKKTTSALHFASYTEIENDFIKMRKSCADNESTEELFTIIFNTKGDEVRNDEYISDSNDYGFSTGDFNNDAIERCINPFKKNLSEEDDDYDFVKEQ